jgi:hypothetical protein
MPQSSTVQAQTVVVPPTANGAQPTVIVIQQPTVAYQVPNRTKVKPPPKAKKSWESCDTIGCQSFRCTFLFQWGSCRTFFGEGGKGAKAGHNGCERCAYP